MSISELIEELKYQLNCSNILIGKFSDRLTKEEEVLLENAMRQQLSKYKAAALHLNSTTGLELNIQTSTLQEVIEELINKREEITGLLRELTNQILEEKLGKHIKADQVIKDSIAHMNFDIRVIKPCKLLEQVQHRLHIKF